jgi:hypothetical protein
MRIRAGRRNTSNASLQWVLSTLRIVSWWQLGRMVSRVRCSTPAAVRATGRTFSLKPGFLPSEWIWFPSSLSKPRVAYPGIPFRTGSLDALDLSTGTVGGVLAWYSLIHHEPDTIRTPLLEFGRVLSPGGALLIGFFEGHVIEKFDHAVAPAYEWPVSDLCDELIAVGFDVVETHARTTTGQRSHGAILAVC